MKKENPKKSCFVVPIVFGVSDYDKTNPLYAWIYQVYVNYASRNNSVVIAQENYLKLKINYLDKYYTRFIKNEEKVKEINQTAKKFEVYSIKNIETEKVINGEEERYKAEIKLLRNKNDYLISTIENRLDIIEKDYGKKVDALMTWIWNPSLNAIAKKRNIKLISLELSPIRKIHTNCNYNTTLCYFQFTNKYDKSYCKDLYDEFLSLIDTKKIQIFSREELLSMFLNTEDLNLLKEIQKPPKYEIGLSPGFERDAFFEKYSSYKIEDTVKKIESLFDTSKVSIRYHPNLENMRGNPRWDKDKSTKSTYWVTKCKRIVSHVSNIGFEAMFFGKTSYILSENMPFSFKSINQLRWIDESVVDSLYLNFMIFAYFTHWNLVFDPEYINWRMSEPNIIEIFNYNRSYVLKLLGITEKERRLTQKQILEKIHKINKEDIDALIKYSFFSSIKELKEENKLYKRRLIKKDTLIKEKEDIINKKNIEIKNIHESTSWKITQPLRELKKTLSDTIK